MTPALPRRDYAPAAQGPLAGLRVLDLSRLFAGNLLTQVLGDFGAEVIKVEPPEGDTLRAWRTEGVATHWKIYARNKKSLCLDLRQPRACELIRALVPSAAMLVESFRPGVLEKIGLAPEALLALKARLVVVRISGWGQDGPYGRARASAPWSRACPASPPSTVLPTASRCCRRCISPTASPASTARRPP